MSKETIIPAFTTDSSFHPVIIYNYGKEKLRFKEIYLKQDSVSIIHGNVVNLYISDKLGAWPRDLNIDFILGICLLAAVNLTKNADAYKYGYLGYGIGFDARSQFLWADGSWGKNVVIFGANINLSADFNNKTKKDILVLDEGPSQGLDDTMVTAEAKCTMNFTTSWRRLQQFLIYQFKAKDSEIKPHSLCLGNISEDFIIDNIKKTGLKDMCMLFLLIKMIFILAIFYIFINI